MGCSSCFSPVKDRECKKNSRSNNKEMSKKPNWFDALKKIFSPDSEEKKQRKDKPKKRWFGKSRSNDALTALASSSVEEITLSQPDTPSTSSFAIPTPQSLLPQLNEIREVRLSEIEADQHKRNYSVALASAVAAEAASVAAQAAAEVVRLTAVTTSSNHVHATQRAAVKSKEEIAAVKIQTAFRTFLAKRALRALKGLARLKSLVDGNTVRRQTEKTLHFIQSQTRIQSEIRSRRRQMIEEKQADLKLKSKQSEQDKLKMPEDWEHSLQTKEQIESGIQTRQEAAIRRERALAYAFSHQWRNASTSRGANQALTDPTNQWGWSWLDRWVAARPWESKPVKLIQPESITDHSSLLSALQSIKTNPNSAPNKSSRPPSGQSPSTPTSRPPSIKARSSSPKPVRSSSPKPVKSSSPKHFRSSSPKPVRDSKGEDSRSIGSVRSERIRRHSIAGSIGDNVSLTSLTSLPVIPSYLQSTESSRAKLRAVYSPISEKLDDKGTVKKRLSFAGVEKTGFGLRSASPVKGRRFSGPPRVELISLKDEE